jgi:septal ring factor EnvC (AmiA/AmiB activator)
MEKYGRLPCDSGWDSQKYHSKHKAIDIGWLTKYGAELPVKAWKSGVVVATGTDSAGGVYVVLKHDHDDYTWISRYWHFKKSSVVVKKGQTVKQGQKLGIRGNTGISSGVHLHFELWKCPKGYTYKSSDMNKYAVNPIKYTYIFDGQKFTTSGNYKLSKKPTEETKEDGLEAQVTSLSKELEDTKTSLKSTEKALQEANKTIDEVRQVVNK